MEETAVFVLSTEEGRSRFFLNVRSVTNLHNTTSHANVTFIVIAMRALKPMFIPFVCQRHFSHSCMAVIERK
jgi:hypothetical protein